MGLVYFIIKININIYMRINKYFLFAIKIKSAYKASAFISESVNKMQQYQPLSITTYKNRDGINIIWRIKGTIVIYFCDYKRIH